jgi:hypothetical protein
MQGDRESLAAWQRDQPLSVLQLDPADRAVLRVAGGQRVPFRTDRGTVENKGMSVFAVRRGGEIQITFLVKYPAETFDGPAAAAIVPLLLFWELNGPVGGQCTVGMILQQNTGGGPGVIV